MNKVLLRVSLLLLSGVGNEAAVTVRIRCGWA